jgi:hypothetical protein
MKTITAYQRQARKIRGLMVAAGVTVGDIVEETGFGRFTVRQVLHGISCNEVVRDAIAKAVNKPVERLFADAGPSRPATKRGRPRKAA